MQLSGEAKQLVNRAQKQTGAPPHQFEHVWGELDPAGGASAHTSSVRSSIPLLSSSALPCACAALSRAKQAAACGEGTAGLAASVGWADVRVWFLLLLQIEHTQMFTSRTARAMAARRGPAAVMAAAALPAAPAKAFIPAAAVAAARRAFATDALKESQSQHNETGKARADERGGSAVRFRMLSVV